MMGLMDNTKRLSMSFLMFKRKKRNKPMNILELFILAVGLSMDAFAVSICKGLSLGKIQKKHMAIAGAWFGGFQALMPLIGYFAGRFFAEKLTQ